ncbi:MAG: SUF system NifU family Fe-S cluster assembly protein [Mobiluncus porci]|uniref:SUF system NifU family Fe-S cluster assembly protein n=1 Tax=Mobiluncus porci TaxID=2652278 RepID=A0A7K0JZR6_9ACTO|nr:MULTISPECIES: SUF system NifU family Fe-S cluster assembly protein [Mobiluncus]MCI6585275.1 SUF system NifU family Fe-S cluster assembly protein [Mobiluncus sp.]MDD7541514.1 SUF system NifU family Fe-S cluster assembly protein [Mobiluncus porci]MDY5748499.1 SUF system NifU family Fe-S cluster assembly protein [Mobiluncus porci]MST48741.1 SUF system NifU family Fe-S cluster assembly protein [Mobiluncus porci]
MNELESLYQQLILEQSKARHGAGTLPGWEASSRQVNPTCGDEVTLQVEVEDGKLKNLVWDGSGCSISQASLSMMYQLVNGQDLDKVMGLEEDFSTMMHSRGKGVDEELLDRLGDASSLEGVSKYVNRVKCALLGWMALKEALAKAEAGLEGSAGGKAPHCAPEIMNQTAPQSDPVKTDR